MNLNASLSNFINNEGEKKLLSLFDKDFVLDKEKAILICQRQQRISYPEIHITPKNIQIETDNFSYVIQKRKEKSDYICYLEDKKKDATISLRRYLDEEDREEFILSRKFFQESTARDDLVESSVHLAPHHISFESHLVESQISCFEIGCMRVKTYRISQEGKMRGILRPFYQNQQNLMIFLEQQYGILKDVSSYLLPHRFEDFAGKPWLKIYK